MVVPPRHYAAVVYAFEFPAFIRADPSAIATRNTAVDTASVRITIALGGAHVRELPRVVRTGDLLSEVESRLSIKRNLEVIVAI